MIKFWNRYGYWIKLGASIVLLALLVSSVNQRTLFDSVFTVPSWYYLAAGLLYGTAQLLTAIRWWLLTGGITLRRIALLTFGTQHIVFLVPSTLTTDLVRVAFLRGEKIDFVERLASLALDKYIGLNVLALTVGSCLVLDGVQVRTALDCTISGFAIALSAIVGLMLLFVPIKGRVADFFANGLSIASRVSRTVNAENIRAFIAGMERTMRMRERVLANILLSVFLQFAAVLSVLTVSVAFDFGIGLFQCALIASMTQVATLVPLSIGGIGLRDVSFVALVGYLGVDVNKAVAATIAPYPIVLVYAAVGWLIATRMIKSR